jgi:hypothetical protein
MMGALLYLQAWTLINRLTSQVRRLRKPKYLAGFVAGGLYFFFYFVRPFWLGSARRRPMSMPEWPADFSAGLELIGAIIVAVIVVGAWIFPSGRAALHFSEAEAGFLFPAPVRRRTLIHFKLLRSQAGILFTTLLMAIFSSRLGPGSTWVRLVGWWLILSTLQLHFIGASFARTRLLDGGVSNTRRRLIVLGFLLLLGVAAWWWVQAHVTGASLAEAKNFKELWRRLQLILETQPLAAFLMPFRLAVRPFLAVSASHFLQLTWPAVLLLVTHYWWVIRSEVAFEEASIELAREKAERVAAKRTPGKALAGKARRAPFVLHPTGPPAVAFLWKNLICAGSFFTVRMAIILAFSFGIPAVIMGLNSHRAEMPVMVGMFLMMGLVWSVLVGPQMFRQDFRHDLRSAELLKLYPLPGWKIVLGELLAPGAILTIVQWIILLCLAGLITQVPGGREIAASERISIALGAALVFPGINLVSLLIPNAGVLLFPAWLQTGPEGPQGIEATGQRLIFLFGQLLVFALTLLPAAGLMVGLHFLLLSWLSWVWVVPLSSLAGAAVLLAETALGVMLLGRLFEKLDVAAELRTNS